MRLLWSLPKAAPAVIKHLAAYVELAAMDIEQAQRDFAARLLASAVLGVSILFAVLMGCLLVVALTWDTPNRVLAVACMGGAFVVLAVFCALYRAKVIGSHGRFLGTVRREWQEDRVVLERILSSHED